MLIYKIEDLVSGKVYIGQTTLPLEKRIYSYKSDVKTFLKGKYKHKSKIIPALAKYGFDNFRFFIIDKAKSQKELDCKERFWIFIHNSTVQGIGFNIQNGGFGVGKHSDETKKIMSEKSKGRIPYNKGKPSKIFGENVLNALLTQEQADSIRLDYPIIKSSVKLAKKYNVSKKIILNVLNNKTYKSLTYIKPVLESKIWYVYLIKSLKDNSIYTGITVDVEARLKTHNEQRGARYTRGRVPFVLVKQFTCSSKSEALKLEYKIKGLSKEEKLKYEPENVKESE